MTFVLGHLISMEEVKDYAICFWTFAKYEEAKGLTLNLLLRC